MAQTEVKDCLSKNNVGWRWLIYVCVSQIRSSLARGVFRMVITLFNEAPKLSQKFAGGKAQRVHMRQTLKFGGLPGSSPAAEVAEA
jgi:hypothetical protein